jgi:hypothetical protein
MLGHGYVWEPSGEHREDMKLEQVITALLYALIPLAGVFLGAYLKGWGAVPSAQALEEVRADLARLTQASSLYVQRQHEVFTEFYRHLRRSHDHLALITPPHPQ